MKELVLLFYPAIVIGLMFYRCNIVKLEDIDDSAWDRGQTKMLQACACVLVILHHLTQDITSYGEVYKGPITILSSMGILFTSVFFFFSGYGLITNVYEKPGYLKNFCRHRLSVILIPFFICNAIGVGVRLLNSSLHTSVKDIIRCVTGILLLNGNGWYIVEIFWLYLIFYFSFKIFKKKDLALIVLILGTIGIIRLGLTNGHDYSQIGDVWFHGEWWYNSTVVFIMGILFARFKKQIVAFSRKYYNALTIISALLFVVLFILEEIVRIRYGYYRESYVVDRVNSKQFTFIMQSLLCIESTWLMLLVNLRIRISNKILGFLSGISTELFLIHGLFIKNIFDFTGTNEFLMYAIVLVCSILAATVVSLVDRGLLRLVDRSEGRKKTEGRVSNQPIWADRKRATIVSISVAVIIIILSGGMYIYNHFVQTRRDYNSECEALKAAGIGDIVEFGRYETILTRPGKEHVEWIVLSIDDKEMVLLSRYGLAGSVYNNSHDIVKWSDSALYKYLKEDFCNEAFSQYEKAVMAEISGTESSVSLLTVSEALAFFSDDIQRQIEITDAAQKKGTNVNRLSKVNYWDVKGYRSSWWWLRGEDESIFAPIVSVDGEILMQEKYVNKPGGAVRPVIHIDLEQLQKVAP